MKNLKIMLAMLVLMSGCSSPAEQAAEKHKAEMAKLQVLTDAIERENSILANVAADAIDRYEIAKREGDKIQVCVQAGAVSASFLQAKNEQSYNHWKKIETNDCERAGVPRP